MQGYSGLSDEEVARRVSLGQVNKSSGIRSRSLSDILRDNVFTYFNLLNLIVFVLLVFTGGYKNTLFMGVVISNSVIGVCNELALKRKLEKISFLRAKTATVIRNGEDITVDAGDIVADDIILYKTGDEILCDCQILQTGFIEVNEHLLTGESDAVVKQEGEEIIGGSYVVSGECASRAVRVGDDSYSNKIILAAKKYKEIDSKIIKSLNILLKYISYAILPLGIILFLSSFFRDTPAFDLEGAINGAGTCIIGMIPSGLYLITTITASVSVLSLSGKTRW